MAVTRIWAIKGYVGDVIRYAANKEKTDFNKLTEEQKALYRSLHYAGNEEKTTLDTEQIRLVEGINCDPEVAAEQMMNTKELYGKTDGIVAYHGYISFKPGEVEPEEAQRIAMEVANRMWGADYEIIVATHMNAHCVHCHLVTNSVSMTDGKKINENKAMYQKFRQTSDEVCLEHGLSIIQNPRGKRVPYNVYKAQQKGIKTKYDHIREDIDSAISHSPDIRYFLADMVSNGYDMSSFYDHNKYATIRHNSDEHGIRLVNLGEQYTPAAIQYRINYRDKKSRWSDYYSNNYRNYNLRERFMVFHFKGAEFYESKYTYEDNFQLNRTLESTMKAITGCVLAGCPVIALLFLALLFAGVLLDEHNQTIHPKSPAMRYSQPRMEFMSKQMELALDKKLYTFQDVEQFIMKTGAELETLKYERSKVYNRIRRNDDPKLIAERERLTKAITEKRTELNIANRIVKDRPDLEARTEIEKQNMREWYFPVQVSIPTPPKNQNKNKGEIQR